MDDFNKKKVIMKSGSKLKLPTKLHNKQSSNNLEKNRKYEALKRPVIETHVLPPRSKNYMSKSSI